MMAEIENWPWWVVWPGLAFGVLGGLVVRDWAMSNSVRKTFARKAGKFHRSKRRTTER